MIDDDEWQERVLRGDDSGSAMRPVQAVCFYDSSLELRGAIDECWQDLRSSFDDADSVAELRELRYVRDNLGMRIDIDAGLEVSVHFYPVVAGVPRDDLAPGCSIALFQLHDDGGGSVDPGQLGELLEWLLQDIVAAATHVELHNGCERFAGGERPLLLSDTSGQLLEMPAGLAGDY